MSDRTMQQKALAGWRGTVPDWVAELAEMAETLGLTACAKRVGCSKTTVSQTISNKYGADLSSVEAKVRGALMGETVECPIMGEIGRHTCLNWQAKPRAVTNALRTQVYQACRNGCPHSRLKGGKDA